MSDGRWAMAIGYESMGHGPWPMGNWDLGTATPSPTPRRNSNFEAKLPKGRGRRPLTTVECRVACYRELRNGSHPATLYYLLESRATPGDADQQANLPLHVSELGSGKPTESVRPEWDLLQFGLLES